MGKNRCITKTFPCYHLNIAPITDQRTLLSHIILSKTLTFGFHYLVSRIKIHIKPLSFDICHNLCRVLLPPGYPKILLISVFSCDLTWCDLFISQCDLFISLWCVFLSVWSVSMFRWSVFQLSTCSCHPRSFSSIPLTGWPRRTDVLSFINYINWQLRIQ